VIFTSIGETRRPIQRNADSSTDVDALFKYKGRPIDGIQVYPMMAELLNLPVVLEEGMLVGIEIESLVQAEFYTYLRHNSVVQNKTKYFSQLDILLIMNLI
jgi:hypothetical protein